MDKTLVGTTLDLITFDREGNFSKFDRCFTKACEYFSFETSDINRRKLRNFAFHYLRTVGYLDANYSGSITKWSVAPATIVQRGASDFILISGSIAARNLLRTISADKIRKIKEADAGIDLPSGLSFFPAVLQLVEDRGEVAKKGALLGLRLSFSYQQNLFSSLPLISSVLDNTLTRADNGPIFTSGSASQFDFSSGVWLPFSGTRPYDPGLYRKEFDYSPAEYFIATSTRSITNTFRVIEREWALVAALAKLNVALPLRYEHQYRRLHVSRLFREVRLPTLLERAFRSGTLLNPSVDKEWVTYEEIFQRSVWQLAAALPIFKIEVV